MQIRKIQAEDTYALRHSILRPHQSIEQCYYPGDHDKKTGHFGAYVNNELVGILSIYEVSSDLLNHPQSWQLRAMATKETVRGQGCGKALIDAVENYALNFGCNRIWARARKEAIGFYKKSGYETIGAEFFVPDIGPHFLIQKLM